MKTMLIAASPCGHERHTGKYIDKTLHASEHKAQLFKRVYDNAGSHIELAWDKDKAIQCLDHTLELSVKMFTNELHVETSLHKPRGLAVHFNHSTIAKNALAEYRRK